MPWNTHLKLYVRKCSLVIDDVIAPSLLVLINFHCEKIVKPNEETVIITAQNRSEVHGHFDHYFIRMTVQTKMTCTSCITTQSHMHAGVKQTIHTQTL